MSIITNNILNKKYIDDFIGTKILERLEIFDKKIINIEPGCFTPLKN